MSFNENRQGTTYAPGWFLANNEDCDRKTRQIAQTNYNVKTSADGGKHVPMGTVFPTNDASAEGIVYEDVDVTTGDMPGSVVLAGTVYEDRLAVTINSNARTALQGKGFKFITASPTVTRPY